MFGTYSCSYLDIVPDEIDTEKDAFEDPTAALRYVYSCYSYLPAANDCNGLDLFTGDEIVTVFEHEIFAAFPKGNYTASNPVISYWNTFFQGLRQCYIFLNNVEKVPGLSDNLKKDYIAQVKFLIGYYHFLLIRCYGPVIVIREEPNINQPASEYLGREPFDDCVKFTADILDEAATNLPPRRSNVYEYGLATSVAAKAIKAKLLLYAASPLFNGNKEFYKDFKDKEGNNLMPLEFKIEKWEDAEKAMLEAITLAKDNDYDLYQNTEFNKNINNLPSNPTYRKLRYGVIESGNPEILFAETRSEGYYGIQNKSMPYSVASAWNGLSPTWNMLNRFYTKNGLPYDEDPEFDSSLESKLQVVTVDEAHSEQAMPGWKTVRFNLDREPRFYAWVTFHGGYYEVMSSSSNGAYTSDPLYKEEKGGARLVCDLLLNGNCSKGPVGGPYRNAYSPTTYMNKKGVDPTNAVSTNLKHPIDYPWPIIRLADLYLGYAEACVETGNLEEAKKYLNYVRDRAGIPSVEESWKGVADLTQDKLREIVRQERMIELYLENQNFWDMRRWLLAEKYFGQKVKGLNDEATTAEEMARLVELPNERKFQSPTNYLLPIPIGDVNKNDKLVNNPGY